MTDQPHTEQNEVGYCVHSTQNVRRKTSSDIYEAQADMDET